MSPFCTELFMLLMLLDFKFFNGQELCNLFGLFPPLCNSVHSLLQTANNEGKTVTTQRNKMMVFFKDTEENWDIIDYSVLFPTEGAHFTFCFRWVLVWKNRAEVRKKRQRLLPGKMAQYTHRKDSANAMPWLGLPDDQEPLQGTVQGRESQNVSSFLTPTFPQPLHFSAWGLACPRAYPGTLPTSTQICKESFCS